jgi:hypothetical protein
MHYYNARVLGSISWKITNKKEEVILSLTHHPLNNLPPAVPVFPAIQKLLEYSLMLSLF